MLLMENSTFDTVVWHFAWQVLINLGLVYKVQQHSGIIFQFVAFIRRRQRAVSEILAAGGRYDLLVRADPKLVDLFWFNFIYSSTCYFEHFQTSRKIEPVV